MPKRSFDIPAPAGEPVEFEISYVRKDRKGRETKETAIFECYPAEFMPASALRYLTDKDNTLAAIGFIDRCIASEADSERFLVLVYDRSVVIRGEELGQILEWLAETYTGRPTEAPTPSGSGQTPIGDTSTDGSPSPDPV
jgi:hypothetical protein